jgi:4-hydroxybutyrate CoA-transferase
MKRVSFRTEYEKKLGSAMEITAEIKSGDKIFTCGEPSALLKTLYDRREQYDNVKLYGMGLGANDRHGILNPEMNGHVDFHISYGMRGEYMAHKKGRNIGYCAAHMSEMESLIKQGIRPDYLMAQATPMDEEGYFTFGVRPLGGRASADVGAKVLLQVNRNLPVVRTSYNRIHISEVYGVCEADEPMMQVPDIESTEVEKQMAARIVERIPNEATMQLGFGGIPNAVGKFLEHHKDLGLHTELLTNSMIHLMKMGVINNSKKTLEPGKTLFGFCSGNQEMFDYMDGNPNIEARSVSWINNPVNIAKNRRMVSINSCIAVDLKGQVCSETIGLTHYSGTGGQVDFVKGARMAEEGQSFIAMPSVQIRSDGSRVSKITLTLAPGSAVTTTRNDVDKIVTEYGVAELLYRSDCEKAKSLIAIAHPDFRDQLYFDAKKAGIIY